jgi:hypothetical protein
MVTILLPLALSCHAGSQEPASYAKLNPDQKKIWQRIMLQGDSFFRPKNADYYLSNTTSPDMANEFDLVDQYLHGRRVYSGQPDAAPWCRFPARFAFAAKVIDGKFVAPEAFRPCNMALPVLDTNLKAYLVKTLMPQDTGQALFHVALIIQGTRFYNGSVMSVNIGFGRNQTKDAHSAGNNDALQLLRAFYGEGSVTLSQNYIPGITLQDAAAEQIYRINLPLDQIYMLSLLAYESKHATMPYSLLRANCHTYLETIFSAIMPESSTEKRWFFDYFPAYMDKENKNNQDALLFEPIRYRDLPYTELTRLSKQLDWQEYQVLQKFVHESTLPGDISSEKFSPALRKTLAKAGELFPVTLITMPDLLTLRDKYLEKIDVKQISHEAIEQTSSSQDIPLFNSPQPSTLRFRAADIDGSARLQLELDFFNTLAGELPNAKPYGFYLGKLNLQVSEHGLVFDHFLVTQQNKVDDRCCGAALYQMGVKKLSGISLDIVNYPELVQVPEWKFKPQLELSMSKGIGTVSNNGFSVQVLPEASLLTYGEFIDLNLNNRVSWTNNEFALSASRMVRIYGPDERRSRPKQTLNIDYKVSESSHVELGYQSFGGNKMTIEAGYVFAF